MITLRHKYNWFEHLERLGNKIPHPIYLFSYLCLIIAISSFLVSIYIPQIKHPITNEVILVNNILSDKGVSYILNSTVDNFVSFKPLGLVLCMMIAVGLMEEVGLASSTMKYILLNCPKRFVTLSIFFVGIVGNLASDAAFILIPPLAGIIFSATNRNPVVGVCAGFVAVAAGYTANLFIAGTDVLLSSITNEVLKTVTTEQINPASNWFFMLVSVPFLVFVGSWITECIVEPKIKTIKNNENHSSSYYQLSEREIKAIKITGWYSIVFFSLLIVFLFPSDSPLRNSDGGFVPSPLLNGIIPIIMVFFISSSIIYGFLSGKLKSKNEIPSMMINSLRSVGGYVLLVFFIAQFISWFNWTNLSLYLSIWGANTLSSIEMPHVIMLFLLILLSAIINLIIFSGSAQWSLLAPVFIPLFYLLGIDPAAVQMAYRIGDSTTNIISPTNPFIPMILAIIYKYDKNFKLGNLLAIMMPYTIILLFSWSLLYLFYYSLDLPIGL